MDRRRDYLSIVISEVTSAASFTKGKSLGAIKE